jgi:hypothetical protein
MIYRVETHARVRELFQETIQWIGTQVTVNVERLIPLEDKAYSRPCNCRYSHPTGSCPFLCGPVQIQIILVPSFPKVLSISATGRFPDVQKRDYTSECASRSSLSRCPEERPHRRVCIPQLAIQMSRRETTPSSVRPAAPYPDIQKRGYTGEYAPRGSLSRRFEGESSLRSPQTGLPDDTDDLISVFQSC